MAPIAICTNPRCRFKVAPNPWKSSPYECPRCLSRLLSHCLSCGYPLVEMPTGRKPLCPVCGLDLLTIRYGSRTKETTETEPPAESSPVEKLSGNGGRTVQGPSGAGDLHRSRKEFHRPAHKGKPPSLD